jgi:hypothetical protein
LCIDVDIDDAPRSQRERGVHHERSERLGAAADNKHFDARPLGEHGRNGAECIRGAVGKACGLRRHELVGVLDQHVIGERHAKRIRQRTTVVDAAHRLQAIGRAERYRLAGIGQATTACAAAAATDLDRNDDEIAGLDCCHLVADIGDDAGGFMAD